MIKKYSSEILSDIHESASDLGKDGIISQESMEQFDRLCLSLEVTGVSCVPDIIELMEPSDIEFLAEKIQANATFVCKIFDRRIIVETIPVSLLSSLAKELGVPYEHLYEYLIIDSNFQDCHISNSQKKSSFIKNRQSFEEAVRSSSLTESEQKNLLALIQTVQTTEKIRAAL